jgi:hypothetical protein
VAAALALRPGRGGFSPTPGRGKDFGRAEWTAVLVFVLGSTVLLMLVSFSSVVVAA